MAISQNGFPVIFSSRSGLLHKWVIPGASRYFLLRHGSAGFLLAHNAMWYHGNLESLSAGRWDDWGWAVRPIRGQTSGYSNHASGTATDLNATQHPRGRSTHGTFSQSEINEIHHHLGIYSGCIRWGGDYNSTTDGMHYEIDRSLNSCEKKARSLMNTAEGERLLTANKGQKAVILS